MRKMFNKKLLLVFLIIGIISMVFATSIFATGTENIDIYNTSKEFIDSATPPIDHLTVWEDLKPIASILMGIGLVVLVCVGSILGVKYMMSGADDKARVKQKLVWFCVAAVLIVAPTVVFNIVVQVASQLE